MEGIETEPGAVRHTREQISEIVVQYDRTLGLTVKEFCKLHKISEASFYSIRRERQQSPLKEVQKKMGFISIHPSGVQPPAALFAEVRGIRIYQMVPPEYLKSLES